jgi:hypothetical protein
MLKVLETLDVPLEVSLSATDIFYNNILNLSDTLTLGKTSLRLWNARVDRRKAV